MSDVADRIRILRTELQLSQKEFSSRLGVPRQSTVSDWENGRSEPNLKILKKLVTLFNINISWITNGSGNMFSDNIEQPDTNDVLIEPSLIASRLRGIRKELLLTQSELSEKIRIPKRTIDNYEREITLPSAEYLFALVNRFGINANWILTGEGSVFIEKNICGQNISENAYSEILQKTQEVLESSSMYSTGLLNNILLFYKAACEAKGVR